MVTAESCFLFSVEIGKDGLRTGLYGKVGDEDGDRCTRQGESGIRGGELEILPLVGDLEAFEMKLKGLLVNY
jgi:hypothetical protein